MYALILISLTVAFLWGVQPLIHKVIFQRGVSFRTIMAVGGVFYFACLSTFVLWNWPTLKVEVRRLDVSTTCLIGATTILTAFLANLLYLYVLKDNPSYVVSALICSSPAFTALLAYAVVRERVSPTGALGVAFVVVGTVLLGLSSKTTDEFVMKD
jgi:drug/metabolite transporter (DMT)-like permease